MRSIYYGTVTHQGLQGDVRGFFFYKNVEVEISAKLIMLTL